MVSRKGLLKAGYNRNLVKMGYINILIAFFHYFTIAPILLEKCDYDTARSERFNERERELVPFVRDELN